MLGTAILAKNMVIGDLSKNRQIGYTETTRTVAIPNDSYAFSSGVSSFTPLCFPSAGDATTLTVDGVVYSGVVKEFVADGMVYLYSGNGASLGMDDTGENYIVAFLPAENAISVGLMDEAGSEVDSTHTVELSITANITHPIDPKFLPHTVVDITDIMTALRNGDPFSLEVSDDERFNAIVKGIETKTLVLEERKSDGLKSSISPAETATIYEENNATGEWHRGYRASFWYSDGGADLTSCFILLSHTQSGKQIVANKA